MKEMLTIAIPNKGRMKPPVLDLLKQIGYRVHGDNNRQLILPTERAGARVLLARAMDIPLMVERRAADIGITGQDTVAERDSAVEQVLELGFSKCKVVLAAPESVENPKSIATALPRITSAFCLREGLTADIITMQGALESAPGLGIAEAIVDQMESGTTLRENNLHVISVIMETQAVLIANGVALDERRAEIDEIVLVTNGLMAANERVTIKVNAATLEIRDLLLGIIPAMKSPDLTPLADEGAVSLFAAVPRKGLEGLIVRVRKAGGTDIIVEEPKLIIA